MAWIHVGLIKALMKKVLVQPSRFFRGDLILIF
jgi:hypothetical protein